MASESCSLSWHREQRPLGQDLADLFLQSLRVWLLNRHRFHHSRTQHNARARCFGHHDLHNILRRCSSRPRSLFRGLRSFQVRFALAVVVSSTELAPLAESTSSRRSSSPSSSFLKPSLPTSRPSSSLASSVEQLAVAPSAWLVGLWRTSGVDPNEASPWRCSPSPHSPPLDWGP